MEQRYFSYRLTKEIYVPLSLSSSFNPEDRIHNEWREKIKPNVMVKESSLFIKHKLVSREPVIMSTVRQMNERYLGIVDCPDTYYFYPLLSQVGNSPVYTCAYCLGDTTNVSVHASECLKFFINAVPGVDCFHCRHIAQEDEFAHHFFDQNHTTKIFTGFVYDSEAKKYAKVDFRHEQIKSKLSVQFFDLLYGVLKHNLFAPIAAAKIVTKHSVEDLCHTSSYLQKMDSELRLRPLVNGSLSIPCFTSTEHYYKELPISPYLMFMLLPATSVNFTNCTKVPHQYGGRNCPVSSFSISSIPDDCLMNGFFVLAQRRLLRKSTDVITYYRTKADPEDHYKYSNATLLDKISAYRVTIQLVLEPVDETFDFNQFLNFTTGSEFEVSPYNCYFAPIFPRLAYQSEINLNEYRTFPPQSHIQIALQLQSETTHVEASHPASPTPTLVSSAEDIQYCAIQFVESEQMQIEQTIPKSSSADRTIPTHDSPSIHSQNADSSLTTNPIENRDRIANYFSFMKMDTAFATRHASIEDIIQEHRSSISELFNDWLFRKKGLATYELSTYTNERTRMIDKKYRDGDIFALANVPIPGY